MATRSTHQHGDSSIPKDANNVPTVKPATPPLSFLKKRNGSLNKNRLTSSLNPPPEKPLNHSSPRPKPRFEKRWKPIQVYNHKNKRLNPEKHPEKPAEKTKNIRKPIFKYTTTPFIKRGKCKHKQKNHPKNQ
jgi:hypothetical protein